MMAGLLQKEDFDELLKWIGGRRKFRLLYKITRDGCSALNFHSKCDGKGMTVTVLCNPSDTVYGGFTSQSWTSAGGAYLSDPKAFLFQLKFNGKSSYNQFPIKPEKIANAVHCNSGYGPIFGGGHDLTTFSGNLTASNGVFTLNGSCALNTTYNMKGTDYNAFANGNLQVKEMEVYQVDDCDMNDPLEIPWRRTPEWTTRLMQELKEEIENYKPLEQLKIQQTKILLIGQIGAGKSSFFNTINSIFRGYVTSQACSGTAEHSLTTQYRSYQVRNCPSGKPLNFRLCDTRGLEEGQGIEAQDVCYILDGNTPDKYVFNPSLPLSSDITGFVKAPKLKDRIHCVAFVLDASSVDVMSEKILEKIRKLQIAMNQRGLPQVVLLTKIDKISASLQDDVGLTYYIPTVQEHVDKVAAMIGLPRSHVIPVKNYESERELNDNINILNLLAMQQILHFADDFLYNYLDDLDEEQISTAD
ncbi:interferon-induced protein 44-like [Crassostrea angulata]|uniref:interferon-induced protein 44-like n=1 Tax=Magallana angulata TaxID=2784310 RepID=UPI0022B0DDB4|nr:interferon-induced protein 44-like [Crassostrea angulata]XP_052705632.1 interferon-induced protein 44-like [Crassostrea angulata]